MERKQILFLIIIFNLLYSTSCKKDVKVLCNDIDADNYSSGKSTEKCTYRYCYAARIESIRSLYSSWPAISFVFDKATSTNSTGHIFTYFPSVIDSFSPAIKLTNEKWNYNIMSSQSTFPFGYNLAIGSLNPITSGNAGEIHVNDSNATITFYYSVR